MNFKSSRPLTSKILQASLAVGIFFSPQAEASPKTFLQNFIPQRATPHVEVLKILRTWGKKPGTYLSLGESHHERETSAALHFKLIEPFLNTRAPGGSRRPFVLCSERISELLKLPQALALRATARQTWLSPAAGPSTTDYRGCQWGPRENAVIFSGFFHQYPFARPWPEEFRPTPVIVQPDNHIRAQLPAGQGIFVTQMELSYLETLATRSLVQNPPSSPESFRRRLRQLLRQSRAIEAQQEILVGRPSEIFRNKYGAFFNASAAKKSSELDDRSWFLITQRGYRRGSLPFGLLRKISSLPRSELQSFLDWLRARRGFVITFFDGPNSDGVDPQIGYAGLSVQSGSEVIDNRKQVLLYQPGSDELSCYERIPTPAGETELVSQDCAQMLKD